MSESKRKSRQYDAEFKQRAIKLYFSSEKSYTELGAELGIPAPTLSTWIHNAKHSYQKNPKSLSSKPNESSEVDLSKELIRLKREMSVVKEERDILKKALAIFSTDNPKR